MSFYKLSLHYIKTFYKQHLFIDESFQTEVPSDPIDVAWHVDASVFGITSFIGAS